jgi:hypothetical protein
MPPSARLAFAAARVVAVTMAALLLLAAPDAEACSCAPANCRSAADYDAVFEATVASIDGPAARADGQWSSADPVTVHLREVRPLRGAAKDTLTTAASSASCGYDFKVGERYLIFAHGDSAGVLTVALCGLTRPVEGSAGLQHYVESLARPSAGGRVFGRVLEPAGPRRALTGVGGARVELAGSHPGAVITRATGEFEFTDLPPGDYQVAVSMPRGRADLSAEAQPVTLENTYACADLSFVARSSARVAGRVVDAKGQPLGGVFLTMGVMGLTSQADGSFVFTNVPPGAHTVGVSLVGGPSRMSPYPPTRARMTSDSTVVQVAPGAQVTLQPLRLVRQVPARLAGYVRSADGAAVPGMPVLAFALDAEGNAVPSAGGRTNTEGRFMLDAYTGMRYRLLVGPRNAPLATVDAEAGGEGVTVTLPQR